MSARGLRRLMFEFSEKMPASPEIVPLLIVPYMGELGRRIVREEGLAWLDLSGNANIKATGLRVLVSGHENRFRQRGRNATPFAPQASRVARQFLLGHQPCYSQKELVQLTALDQGFVSRILRRLEQDRFIKRRDSAFAVTNRALLLESWRAVYDFTKHRIIKGHIAARSSENLLSLLSGTFHREGVLCAATGLAGAWLLTHFASFRLVTVYLKDKPSPEVLTKLGFREEDNGANVWLVIPNDEGVFLGQRKARGHLVRSPSSGLS